MSLLCLLAMTGNLWSPTAPAPACGDGIRAGGEACDDGNTVPGDCCGPTCQHEPAGSACDDGDPCTTADACAAGVCAGSLEPAPGCAAAPGGRLTLTEQPGRPRRLAWRWSAGTVAAGGFGDPVAGGTSHAVCVYDAAGLRLRAGVPAGGTCGARPCWRGTRTGLRYANRTEAPGGVRALALKTGTSRASIALLAKGGNLAPLGLPLSPDFALTVQLKASGGGCWEARFTGPAVRNDAATFVDAPD